MIACVHGLHTCVPCVERHIITEGCRAAVASSAGDSWAADQIERALHADVLQTIMDGVDDPDGLARFALLPATGPTTSSSEALRAIAVGAEDPRTIALMALAEPPIQLEQFAIRSGVAMRSEPRMPLVDTEPPPSQRDTLPWIKCA